MLFFPRFTPRKYALSPPTEGGDQFLVSSPPLIFSILMTSAPMSPSIIEAYGTASPPPSSRTFISSKGSSDCMFMSQPLWGVQTDWAVDECRGAASERAGDGTADLRGRRGAILRQIVCVGYFPEVRILEHGRARYLAVAFLLEVLYHTV